MAVLGCCYILTQPVLFAGDSEETQTNIVFLRDFEPPGDLAENISPYHMAVGPNGRIFLMDQDNYKVVIWDKNGKFIKTFGKRGKGPGEIGEPWSIAVDGSELLLWDYNQRVSVFDLDGNFKRTFRSKVRSPKVFMPIGEGRLLSTRQIHTRERPGVQFQIFEVIDAEGNTVETAHMVEDKFMLKSKPGVNTSTRVAFSPEPAMQIDPQGKGAGEPAT